MNLFNKFLCFYFYFIRWNNLRFGLIYHSFSNFYFLHYFVAFAWVVLAEQDFPEVDWHPREAYQHEDSTEELSIDFNNVDNVLKVHNGNKVGAEGHKLEKDSDAGDFVNFAENV